MLEPLVTACFPSTLQHLIMIGDHKQLRPNVECYDLEMKYKFGVSLFERLVENNVSNRLLVFSSIYAKMLLLIEHADVNLIFVGCSSHSSACRARGV